MTTTLTRPKVGPGQRFGRLLILWATPERDQGCIVWECQCDCGMYCRVATLYLTRGEVKSCGCLRREMAATKHLPELPVRHLPPLEYGNGTACRPNGPVPQPSQVVALRRIAAMLRQSPLGEIRPGHVRRDCLARVCYLLSQAQPTDEQLFDCQTPLDLLGMPELGHLAHKAGGMVMDGKCARREIGELRAGVLAWLDGLYRQRRSALQPVREEALDAAA